MSSDEHSRPTSIGSELRVLTDDGELAGFIGEAKDGPQQGLTVYARPCHEQNATVGVKWFASRDEAISFLKASLDN